MLAFKLPATVQGSGTRVSVLFAKGTVERIYTATHVTHETLTDNAKVILLN